MVPLLVYEKARDHFDGATVREIEREVSETSDMLRDEMANAKKAAKDR